MVGELTGLLDKGGKEHYILDIEDTEKVRTVIEILEPITPLPRPRNKKK